MEIGFTTVSSKGQIVIPKEFRKSFRQGDKLVLIKEGTKMVLKQVQELVTEEDKDFLRGVEEGLKDFDEGRYHTRTKKEFLREFDKP